MIDPFFCGARVRISHNMREGEVILLGSAIGGHGEAFAAPLTHWRLCHPGRDPLLSRHCRGIRELERDRRRYPRPVEAT